MTQDQNGSSRLVVTVAHTPIDFIYELFTPTIDVNGQIYHLAWGTHMFEVAPGDYDVAVSYPWLLTPECGKNSVHVTVAAGETKKIIYTAGLIRFVPGKITVG